MALDITYNWNFNPLESYPTSAGESDVVFMAHWQLYASTGSYSASAIGTQTVAAYEEGQPFTPFNELTYDQVKGWVLDAMNVNDPNTVDNLYASLEAQIQNQINPPVLVQQAPWLSTPVPPLPEPEIVVIPESEVTGSAE